MRQRGSWKRAAAMCAYALWARWKRCVAKRAENAAYFSSRIFEILSDGTAEALLSDLSGQVLVDALLGVGLHHEVTGLYKRVIELVNDSGAYIVACDIPSGIDADTGQICGAAVLAHETVTFQCAKPGHFLYPGRKHTGKLTVRSWAPPAITISETCALWMDSSCSRDKNSYKNLRALACVVGTGFGRGPYVRGGAAFRRGLLTAGMPTCLQPIFSSRCPKHDVCWTYRRAPRNTAFRRWRTAHRQNAVVTGRTSALAAVRLRRWNA